MTPVPRPARLGAGKGERIGKRAFYTTVVIAAGWLLVFAAVALAIGPDGARASRRQAVDPGLAIGTTARVASTKAATAALTDPAARGLSALERVRFAAAILSPKALEGVSPALAKERAADWAEAVSAGGGDPISAIGEILPSALWFQARIVTKRDESDIAADAKAAGEFGEAYAELARALAGTRAASSALEAALEEIWRRSGLASSLKQGPVSPLKRSDRWIPGKSTLKSAHQYALDVFFTSVKRHGAVETGPTIRSMGPGIVVSAAGDWSGGDQPSLYRAGGLSPKSGNGVVVYDPAARRYYVYFHMCDVSVRAGQVVTAGQSLGRGGNTGVNARKKGHGGHVHIEIHDADGGAWTSYAIRDLILSIR